MRILAVMNQKGGSGKTTVAVNLAASLAGKKRRVLLIDLDPQANASQWLGVDDDDRGLFDALTGQGTSQGSAKGRLADLVRPTDVTGLSLIPASAWMSGIERALAQEPGAELILRHKLHALASSTPVGATAATGTKMGTTAAGAKGGGPGPQPAAFDEVILDCPPTLGVLVVSALSAASHLLVPVESHVMALSGLAQLWKTVELVRERLNPGLQLAGIVACRVDARTRHGPEVVAELRRRFGADVFDTVIRENVRVAEAPSFRKPLSAYDPKGTGAKDFADLAREYLKRPTVAA